MARTSLSGHPLTDHDEIRQWAEERDAKPACVRGTGSRQDVGMIRLDFPGFSGEDSLEEISWDDWFDKFEESHLALLVQDQTARGERSNFNKLVNRETAGSSGRAGRRSGRSARAQSSSSQSRASRSKRASSSGRTSGTRSKSSAQSNRSARSSRSVSSRAKSVRKKPAASARSHNSRAKSARGASRKRTA